MSPMRTTFGLAFLLALVVSASPAHAQARPAKPLTIYYIDTEGGQATLFVAPSGESLLVDTGNPGGRDTDRIQLAMADAGVTQIDHLVLTHYHVDHIGGLEELAKRVPIKHFYDHGPTSEPREQSQGFQAMYAALNAKALHTVAKPGDKIAIPGLDVTSRRVEWTSPEDKSARRRPSQPGVRRLQGERSQRRLRSRQRDVRGIPHDVRPLPDRRSGRSDLESRRPADVPEQ